MKQFNGVNSPRLLLSCLFALAVILSQIFQFSIFAEGGEKITIVGLARGTKMVQIDAGTRKGISKGMILTVKRAGKNIGKIEITSANDFSARGNILEGEKEIELEDELFTDGQVPQNTPSSQTGNSVSGSSIPSASNVNTETLKSIETKIDTLSTDIKSLKGEVAEMKNDAGKLPSSIQTVASTSTVETPQTLPSVSKTVSTETISTSPSNITVPSFIAALGANFAGETGLILVPTAETLKAAEIRLNVLQTKIFDEKTPIGTLKETDSGITVAFGASDNLEVVIGMTEASVDINLPGILSFSDKIRGTTFSLRYALPVSKKSPAIFALEARYMGLKSPSFTAQGQDERSQTILLAIVSKALGKEARIKGHFGGGLNISKYDYADSAINDVSKNQAVFAAGLEIILMPRLTLSAEYVKEPDDNNENTEDRTIGFGARYAVTRQINFTAAMVSFGQLQRFPDQKGYNYFFGLSFTFGGRKE